MLYEMLYVSEASEGTTPQTILEILKESRRNNEENDITGLLVFYKNHFLQILEGEEDRIRELLENIQQDKRHHSVFQAWMQPSTARKFANWRMAFQDLEDVDTSKLEGFSEFLDKGFTDEIVSENKGMIQEMLVLLKDRIEEKS